MGIVWRDNQEGVELALCLVDHPLSGRIISHSSNTFLDWRAALMHLQGHLVYRTVAMQVSIMFQPVYIHRWSSFDGPEVPYGNCQLLFCDVFKASVQLPVKSGCCGHRRSGQEKCPWACAVIWHTCFGCDMHAWPRSCTSTNSLKTSWNQ